MSNELIPVSEEQSKAIQEVAKTTGQGIEAATKFFTYLASVLGTAPHDLVGWIIGDRLREARIRNLFKLQQRTEELLKHRNVKEPQKVSEDIAVPLLDAAREQDREELQELWARLLAAAMDPARSARVSRRFVETLKQMEPLDALIMKELSQSASHQPNTRDYCATKFKVSSDFIEVSLAHLEQLGCARSAGNTAPANAGLVPYGRTLMGVLN